MSTTPAGVTIQAVRPDGSTVDITEGVQALYDGVIGSMDWGSGFWTIEEAVPVAKVAHVCGFKEVDEVDRYLVEKAREDKRKALCRQGVEFGVAIERAKALIPDVEAALRA